MRRRILFALTVLVTGASLYAIMVEVRCRNRDEMLLEKADHGKIAKITFEPKYSWQCIQLECCASLYRVTEIAFGPKIDADDVTILQYVSELETLDISGNVSGRFDITLVSTLSHLHTLTVGSWATPNDIVAFVANEDLVNLRLYDVTLDDDAWEALRRMNRLSYLELNNCRYDADQLRRFEVERFRANVDQR